MNTIGQVEKEARSRVEFYVDLQKSYTYTNHKDFTKHSPLFETPSEATSGLGSTASIGPLNVNHQSLQKVAIPPLMPANNAVISANNNEISTTKQLEKKSEAEYLKKQIEMVLAMINNYIEILREDFKAHLPKLIMLVIVDKLKNFLKLGILTRMKNYDLVCNILISF